MENSRDGHVHGHGMWNPNTISSASQYELSRGISSSTIPYDDHYQWGGGSNSPGGGNGNEDDYIDHTSQHQHQHHPAHRYHRNDSIDHLSIDSQYTNPYYYDSPGNYPPPPPQQQQQPPPQPQPNYYPTKSDAVGGNSAGVGVGGVGVGGGPVGYNPSPPNDSMLGGRNAHETRHARRLYVGGIPAGQTSEEHLRSYLNEVISRCLGEDNNNSYTVSIYMNHKKCFAFVELKSIELTNACLELDGVIYCSSVLRIQRANEYKPELLATLPPLKPLKFNLSKAPFLENSAHTPKDYKRIIDPEPLPMSLIRPCSIAEVIPGCVAIVGFPYDEGARRSGLPPGSAAAPGVLRYYLSKLLQSHINNEFGIDLSKISILDVGDVPFGLSLEEALSRLNDAIVELIKRGAVPIVLGGSHDQSYPIAGGLMDVVGGNIGVVNINSRLSVNQLSVEMKIESASANRLLFSDSRFCPPKDSYSEPTCDGKLVIYGAQGTYCTPEHVNFLQRRGGHIVWLSKDIRKQTIFGIKSNPASRRTSDSSAADDTFETHVAAQHLLNSSFNDDDDDANLFTASSTQSILTRNSGPTTPLTSIPSQFPKLLQYLSSTPLSLTLSNRSLYVSFSLSSIQDMASPGMSLRSPQGFTSEEALLLCRQTGVDSNVHIFDIHGFNPTIEESRTGCLVAEMIYQFLLGYSQRRLISTRSQSRLGHHISRNYSRSPVDSKSMTDTKTSNNSLLL